MRAVRSRPLAVRYPPADTAAGSAIGSVSWPFCPLVGLADVAWTAGVAGARRMWARRAWTARFGYPVRVAVPVRQSRPTGRRCDLAPAPQAVPASGGEGRRPVCSIPCHSWFRISASCVVSRHCRRPPPPTTPAERLARAGRTRRLFNLRRMKHCLLYWSRSRRMASVSCASPGQAWLEADAAAPGPPATSEWHTAWVNRCQVYEP